jgi:hypothetical protein
MMVRGLCRKGRAFPHIKRHSRVRGVPRLTELWFFLPFIYKHLTPNGVKSLARLTRFLSTLLENLYNPLFGSGTTSINCLMT